MPHANRLAAACLLTLALASALRAAPVAGKPNMLLVIADDQTIRDAGCYGSPDVKTPNIDRLAAEGMKFMRAFTATAMCAPTRTQLYTGLYPIRSGAWPNHSGVFPHVKSLPHYLQALGYRVALAGKTHIKPRDNFPFVNRAPGSRSASGPATTPA